MILDINVPLSNIFQEKTSKWWGRPDSDMSISLYLDSYRTPTSELKINVIQENVQKITDLLKYLLEETERD